MTKMWCFKLLKIKFKIGHTPEAVFLVVCDPPMNKLWATYGLYYKCFTNIIYDRNDSGQYYKTTITIVIDDPSWQF